MIENLPGRLSMVAPLRGFLDALPELGFHLDIGHANLSVPENTTQDVIAAFGTRLRHVHLHDNKGGSQDLHLPLDRHYLTHSREVLRRIWDEAPGP
jgi:sugar phosphate isomerase/epimerase